MIQWFCVISLVPDYPVLRCLIWPACFIRWVKSKLILEHLGPCLLESRRSGGKKARKINLKFKIFLLFSHILKFCGNSVKINYSRSLRKKPKTSCVWFLEFRHPLVLLFLPKLGWGIHTKSYIEMSSLFLSWQYRKGVNYENAPSALILHSGITYHGNTAINVDSWWVVMNILSVSRSIQAYHMSINKIFSHF